MRRPGRLDGRGYRMDERGASLVEFVLILPLAALILFGLIDFGFVFQGYTQMRNGVQAGARLASQNEAAYEDTASVTCTGGPDANTGNLLCSIIAGLGPPTGLKAGSLQVGIAFTTPTNPNSGTSEQDVTVCAKGTLNSTSGFIAGLIVGETMSSSNTILISGTSPLTFNYSAYTSAFTSSSPNVIKYNGIAVPGESC